MTANHRPEVMTAPRDGIESHDKDMTSTIKALETENAKLKELVRDMWRDGMCDCDEQYTCAECEYGYHKRMEELGIEVQE